MLFHRLTVLGALAILAVTADAGKDNKKKDTETKQAAGATPEMGVLYMDGCPCYQQAEVDAFLTFAKGAECSVSDYGDGTANYVSMYITASAVTGANTTTTQSLSIDKYSDIDGSCQMSTMYTDNTTVPADVQGAVDASKSSYAYMDPGSASEDLPKCEALMMSLKDLMPTAGCAAFSLYPCEYPCSNGDCGTDKCQCYPGWTGDACDVCDDSYCVNGSCDIYGYGCQCDIGWAYPDCSTCEVGFIGDNCDECDPAQCINGECTPSGCVCNPGWDQYSYPPCSTCTYGFSGDNCDVCECGNGNCTEYGCQCEPNWDYSTNCATCMVGWMGENCDECDPEGCGNGECGDSGCECFPGWEQYSQPPCSWCEYGWVGANCDVCDESACANGECSDTGCVCNDKWTGQYCDSCVAGWASVDGVCGVCDLGWAGDNCDTCDPVLCDSGFCSSCMNGVCTSEGCTCDEGWFGAECSSPYAEGCPCWAADDVATFLSWAGKVEEISGSCSYYSDGEYTSVDVSTGQNYQSMVMTDTMCASFRTDYSMVPMDATEAAACMDVFVSTGVSEKIQGLDCSNSGGYYYYSSGVVSVTTSGNNNNAD